MMRLKPSESNHITRFVVDRVKPWSTVQVARLTGLEYWGKILSCLPSSHTPDCKHSVSVSGVMPPLCHAMKPANQQPRLPEQADLRSVLQTPVHQDQFWEYQSCPDSSSVNTADLGTLWWSAAWCHQWYTPHNINQFLWIYLVMSKICLTQQTIHQIMILPRQVGKPSFWPRMNELCFCWGVFVSVNYFYHPWKLEATAFLLQI